MMQLSPARSLAAAASAVSLCSAKIFMVPMRDGVELHTIVDLPELPDDRKDLTNVVDKSPYGQDAIELITLLYSILLPMAGVRQDMRGTKKSQGNFTIWHDSADDDYDTMQWLTQQSWANDKVPSVYMGFSADGISAYTAVKARPEWLKAYFIGWSTAAGYPIIYPGGAYRKSLTDFWMRVTIPGQSAR
jgi:predicted acyl esterase